MNDTRLSRTPSVEDFRALARSSPWRFTTLHFTHHQHSAGAPVEVVHAWLNRRTRRVTVLSSRGVEVAEDAPYNSSTFGPGAGTRVSGRPVLRSDGLVAERPGDWHLDHGDPMWQNYRWTAMLDPAELSSGVEIDDVSVTTRGGRLSWTAVCRPLIGIGEDWAGGYDPRCGCCPLLDSTASRLPEYGADGADGSLPTTYRVHLDLQTGIVVRIDALDGPGGRVLCNDIHSVDEPLDPPHARRLRRHREVARSLPDDCDG